MPRTNLESRGSTGAFVFDHLLELNSRLAIAGSTPTYAPTGRIAFQDAANAKVKTPSPRIRLQGVKTQASSKKQREYEECRRQDEIRWQQMEKARRDAQREREIWRLAIKYLIGNATSIQPMTQFEDFNLAQNKNAHL